jgi:fumarate hydratase subunit beta
MSGHNPLIIKTPLDITSSKTLPAILKPKILDEVLISGNKVFTLRDMSAAALFKDDNRKKDKTRALPVNLKGAAVYFCAPSYIAGAGNSQKSAIGSCGPTTTNRMADYIPHLISEGVKIFIGKGPLPPKIINIIKKNKCLYLLAIGGCGAYYTQFITACRIAAYPGLGPEAILELTVEKIPFIVGVDARGKSAFK